MTFKSLIIFAVTFLILKSGYSIFEYWVIKTTYIQSQSKLSLIDYCVSTIGSFKWRLRKFLKLKWFNYFQVYKFFTILNSILLVLFSICLLILYFCVNNSEYAELLRMKF